MSGTIWLIVEDENDGDVVKMLLKKRSVQVRVEVRPPTGGTGSISRLAKQLTRLIADVKSQMGPNDCIAVLHDYDIHKAINRESYEQIKQICAAEKVKEIIARDELEAWILADSGTCKWLRMKPKKWDELPKPSDTLDQLMRRRYQMKYQGSGRAKVIAQLNGDGDKFSQSMQDALKHLDNAPCIR